MTQTSAAKRWLSALPMLTYLARCRAEKSQSPVGGDSAGGFHALDQVQPVTFRRVPAGNGAFLGKLLTKVRTALARGIPAETGDRLGDVHGVRAARQAQPQVVIHGEVKRFI